MKSKKMQYGFAHKVTKSGLASARTHMKVPKTGGVKVPPNSRGLTSSTFRRGRNF